MTQGRRERGRDQRQVKPIRTFSAPRHVGPYGHRMGHFLFAIAAFVGLCLIVEWALFRLEEKRDGRRF
jgi:hypothetical protein